VFCLPSTHEGTGLAALEAGAAGARVVITRNGGAPDYFLHHAWYVDPDSVASIRGAIETAWHAPVDDRLRQHIAQRLSWLESGKSLERAYLTQLERKAPRPLAAAGGIEEADAARRADFA
jgi:glycosyltransferase involved in cell wall biosynthesis